MICRFLSPTCRFCVTIWSMMSDLRPGESSPQEVTTNRHECAAADIGGVQSHSSTAGCSGRSEAMVCFAPIGIHGLDMLESPGNAVQKSDGRSGRPGVASA